MIKEAVRENPNRWPVPRQVCQAVAEELLEASQEGPNQAISVGIRHGIFDSPVKILAKRQVKQDFAFTAITGKEGRYSREFGTLISGTSTPEGGCNREDGCYVMVGVFGNKMLDGASVPVGIQTSEGLSSFELVTLEDLLGRKAYGKVEEDFELSLGSSARIYLPTASLPGL